MSKIDIKGIDKADLLAALVNGTSPLGVGVLIALTEPGGMTREEAAKLCAKHLCLPTRYSSIAQQRFMAARACSEDQVDRNVGRLNEWLCLRPGPGRVRQER